VESSWGRSASDSDRWGAAKILLQPAQIFQPAAVRVVGSDRVGHLFQRLEAVGPRPHEVRNASGSRTLELGRDIDQHHSRRERTRVPVTGAESSPPYSPAGAQSLSPCPRASKVITCQPSAARISAVSFHEKRVCPPPCSRITGGCSGDPRRSPRSTRFSPTWISRLSMRSPMNRPPIKGRLELL